MVTGVPQLRNADQMLLFFLTNRATVIQERDVYWENIFSDILSYNGPIVTYDYEEEHVPEVEPQHFTPPARAPENDGKLVDISFSFSTIEHIKHNKIAQK